MGRGLGTHHVRWSTLWGHTEREEEAHEGDTKSPRRQVCVCVTGMWRGSTDPDGARDTLRDTPSALGRGA